MPAAAGKPSICHNAIYLIMIAALELLSRLLRQPIYFWCINVFLGIIDKKTWFKGLLRLVMIPASVKRFRFLIIKSETD